LVIFSLWLAVSDLAYNILIFDLMIGLRRTFVDYLYVVMFLSLLWYCYYRGYEISYLIALEKSFVVGSLMKALQFLGLISSEIRQGSVPWDNYQLIIS
jgi:hypothetical protein